MSHFNLQTVYIRQEALKVTLCFIEITREEKLIMNAIKLYLNEIVREITRVWMPTAGIGILYSVHNLVMLNKERY